ncbi:MAG: DUF1461 domain-containing protein [Nanobdellota archaeon]
MRQEIREFLILLSKIVVTVSVANLIILGSLYFLSFNEDFYEKEFDKLDIDLEGDYKHEFYNALDYVKGKDVSLGDFFNEKEIKHFKDVREIFSFIKNMLIVSGILLLLGLYLGYEGIANGAILGFLFTFITGLASLIDFSWVFQKMHELIFTNDLWKMDYFSDKIIRIMPQELFIDLGMRWFFYAGMLSIFIFLAFLISYSYYLSTRGSS